MTPPRLWTLFVASLLLALPAAALIGLCATRAGLGPLSSHMTQHIVLMNVGAPVIGYFVVRTLGSPTQLSSIGVLAFATALQTCLLWMWHLPMFLDHSSHGSGLPMLAQGSLFLAALMFWISVLSVRSNDRWMPIFALLLTGKLFCLLGALLIFSPRSIYQTHFADALADQQLAGLLMIAACPLTYVTAGVAIASSWVFELEEQEAFPPVGGRSASK
jgi:putative membrane protein